MSKRTPKIEAQRRRFDAHFLWKIKSLQNARKEVGQFFFLFFSFLSFSYLLLLLLLFFLSLLGYFLKHFLQQVSLVFIFIFLFFFSFLLLFNWMQKSFFPFSSSSSSSKLFFISFFLSFFLYWHLSVVCTYLKTFGQREGQSQITTFTILKNKIK